MQGMSDANFIIDTFGGTSKVAEMFTITTGAVSQWRSSGIPDARLMYLRLLRPDVFADAPAVIAEKVA